MKLHGPELGQEASCGRRIQQVATTVSDHYRHRGSRRINVRHHMHFPHSLDLIVVGLKSSLGDVTRIGHENIEGSVFLDRFGNYRGDSGFIGDI